MKELTGRDLSFTGSKSSHKRQEYTPSGPNVVHIQCFIKRETDKAICIQILDEKNNNTLRDIWLPFSTIHTIVPSTFPNDKGNKLITVDTWIAKQKDLD